MSELLQFPAPNNKRELFERLRAILREGQFEMPTEPRYNGTGAPGCYLEDLLGLRVGNQDIADVAGWEVKFYNPQTSLITLFHKEPDSRTVMRYLVSTYGRMDGQGRLSFRHTVKGQSDRFTVVNDAGNIIVRPLDGTDGPVPRGGAPRMGPTTSPRPGLRRWRATSEPSDAGAGEGYLTHRVRPAAPFLQRRMA